MCLERNCDVFDSLVLIGVYIYKIGISDEFFSKQE
jgi:hypothetical protein